MVEINNLTGFKFDKKNLEKLAEGILSGEKRAGTDLSITFIGPKEIQKLNKKYRKTDKPTDVLSFTYLPASATPKALQAGKNSGEIVICPETVKQNAKKYGETFEKETVRVLIHGILHILGYDHEKKDGKMIKKQEYYLKKLLTTRK